MSRRRSSRRAAAPASAAAALPNPVQVQSVLCRSPTYADLTVYADGGRRDLQKHMRQKKGKTAKVT